MCPLLPNLPSASSKSIYRYVCTHPALSKPLLFHPCPAVQRPSFPSHFVPTGKLLSKGDPAIASPLVSVPLFRVGPPNDWPFPFFISPLPQLLIFNEDRPLPDPRRPWTSQTLVTLLGHHPLLSTAPPGPRQHPIHGFPVLILCI